jgi:hypothetical protein
MKVVDWLVISRLYKGVVSLYVFQNVDGTVWAVKFIEQDFQGRASLISPKYRPIGEAWHEWQD